MNSPFTIESDAEQTFGNFVIDVCDEGRFVYGVAQLETMPSRGDIFRSVRNSRWEGLTNSR